MSAGERRRKCAAALDTITHCPTTLSPAPVPHAVVDSQPDHAAGRTSRAGRCPGDFVDDGLAGGAAERATFLQPVSNDRGNVAAVAVSAVVAGAGEPQRVVRGRIR